MARSGPGDGIHSHIDSKHLCTEQLASISKLINIRGTGKVSLEEFEECRPDEQLHAYLASTVLTANEAFSLFKSLDRENEHLRPVDDFVIGCPEFLGQARTIDVAGMMYEARRIGRGATMSWLRSVITAAARGLAA